MFAVPGLLMKRNEARIAGLLQWLVALVCGSDWLANSSQTVRWGLLTPARDLWLP